MKLLVSFAALLHLAGEAKAQAPIYEDEIAACSDGALTDPTSCFGVTLTKDGQKDSSLNNCQAEPEPKFFFDQTFNLPSVNAYNALVQQPIWGALSGEEGDFDCYSYTIGKEEFDRAEDICNFPSGGFGDFLDRPPCVTIAGGVAAGKRTALLSAYTLKLACLNGNDFFFNTAIVAPPYTLYDPVNGLLGPTDYNELPSELAQALDDADIEDMTVVYTQDGPPDSGDINDRKAFFVPDEFLFTGAQETPIGWFRPKGCNFIPNRIDCAADPDARAINIYAVEGASSSSSSSSDENVEFQVKYVVWSTDGESGPKDYTLDIGLTSISFDRDFMIEELRRLIDYNHMINGCQSCLPDCDDAPSVPPF